ncbi:hypothetical protein [Okeania sp. SIO2B3]|uniref:hypothetical protein n=1 Tax=Okeania sp. SIO2B3 TaxID=2607784 RepID=UPI0013C165DD|nr:hypothetical protein [Okeania sp. SIO2B3]NET42383.1 hypothetical protein [Okeania sp. SIO2B3]
MAACGLDNADVQSVGFPFLALAINSVINWSVCWPTRVAKINPGSGCLSHPNPTISSSGNRQQKEIIDNLWIIIDLIFDFYRIINN